MIEHGCKDRAGSVHYITPPGFIISGGRRKLDENRMRAEFRRHFFSDACSAVLNFRRRPRLRPPGKPGGSTPSIVYSLPSGCRNVASMPTVRGRAARREARLHVGSGRTGLSALNAATRLDSGVYAPLLRQAIDSLQPTGSPSRAFPATTCSPRPARRIGTTTTTPGSCWRSRKPTKPRAIRVCCAAPKARSSS